MKPYRIGSGIILCCLLGGPYAHGQDNLKNQAEDHGKNLAQLHCSRCHVVDNVNLFSGISSTPSFPLLVNHLEDWEERFQSFHTRLPHPSIVRFKGDAVDPEQPVLSVPVELEYTDIKALVEYARSLKKAQ